MAVKSNRYEFIWKAIQKHGYKYDYRKVDYKNGASKVCIICPEHGGFWQKANHHISGNGCSKCAGNTKLSIEWFIEKAQLIHGDKYNYSKVCYSGIDNKVCIICPEHGEFWQSPYCHLKGQSCPKCYGTYLRTTEEFIAKSIQIHSNKYDYSKVKYKGNKIKVCIICPEHGEFWQLPCNHLQSKGCPKCIGRMVKCYDDFIMECIKKHGDKYDYSKVSYINSQTKVCIICKTHGEFWQTPNNHLYGKCCQKCCGNMKMMIEEFIEKANGAHGDKYDYSKVNYIDTKTKVCIICQKHGEFWQRPSSHLQGMGCPICNESKLEKETAQLLDEHGIIYERQKHFEWLGRQSLDFYLPLYRIGIECQGNQHFKPISFGSKKENADNISYQEITERDERKLKLCNENDVKILYYGNKKNCNELLNKEELIEKIYE